MAVDTNSYGSWVSHTGTLAEVMGVILGKGRNYVVSFGYDADNNVYFAICHGD